MKPSRTERRRSPARPAPAPRSRDATPREEPAREAPGAAIALLVTLIVLAAARAAFTFIPGTWLWPLAVPRFLAPVAAWLPWLIATAVLLPPVARRVTPLATAWGDAIARRSAVTPILGAAGAAALVLLLPDQVRFVGDFLLRQGTVEVVEQPGVLFPQALPLDVFLHYTVPLQLSAMRVLDANGAARLLGAIDAA